MSEIAPYFLLLTHSRNTLLIDISLKDLSLGKLSPIAKHKNNLNCPLTLVNNEYKLSVSSISSHYKQHDITEIPPTSSKPLCLYKYMMRSSIYYNSASDTYEELNFEAGSEKIEKWLTSLLIPIVKQN